MTDPRIRAVGFTGSRSGGISLTRLAQSRAIPIPVFAEMSSINPVLLLPHALAARAANLGNGFAASLTMGVGQFCTNPGLLIAIGGDGLDLFIDTARDALSREPAAPMLTNAIQEAYVQGVKALAGHPAVDMVTTGPNIGDDQLARAYLMKVAARNLRRDGLLCEEIFGPASLLVVCNDITEVVDILEGLDGQLTATIQMDDEDHASAAKLMPILERKAGRILANGWPTGVEVTHSMVHGGPFPATSDGRSTSVGSLAIDRFLRPICYQAVPQNLLPAQLQDASRDDFPRLVDGVQLNRCPRP